MSTLIVGNHKRIGNNDFYSSKSDATLVAKRSGTIYETSEGYAVLGGLEGCSPASIDLIRNATRVFHYERGEWRDATGATIFEGDE